MTELVLVAVLKLAGALAQRTRHTDVIECMRMTEADVRYWLELRAARTEEQWRVGDREEIRAEVQGR